MLYTAVCRSCTENPPKLTSEAFRPWHPSGHAGANTQHMLRGPRDRPLGARQPMNGAVMLDRARLSKTHAKCVSASLSDDLRRLDPLISKRFWQRLHDRRNSVQQESGVLPLPAAGAVPAEGGKTLQHTCPEDRSITPHNCHPRQP